MSEDYPSNKAIGDICERTYCHKVLFYVANKFVSIDLCSRYYDIRKIGGKHDIFCYLRYEQLNPPPI